MVILGIAKAQVAGRVGATAKLELPAKVEEQLLARWFAPTLTEPQSRKSEAPIPNRATHDGRCQT
jgi:hypothetical protein